jgi:integrase
VRGVELRRYRVEAVMPALVSSVLRVGEGTRPAGKVNTRLWCPASPRPASTSLRVHHPRHAHAYWLLGGDAKLKFVMERRGDAQIMTTQVYLHTLPDVVKRERAALESVRRRDSG